MTNWFSLTPDQIKRCLNIEFQARCARNSRYSLRSYAQSLKVSHSLLSLVLSGKRRPSQKIAQLVTGFATFRAYMETLPEASTGDFCNLGETRFQDIATWVHYGILGLLDLPQFKAQGAAIPKKIATLLRISPVQAKAAWGDLVDGKFIEKNGDRWVPVAARFTLTNSKSTDSTRAFIRDFLKKADESLDVDHFGLRNLTSITFAMNEADMPYAIEKIKQFRRKLCKELEERSKPSRVYTLALQLFPISEVVVDMTHH